jgi:hypothetical protein
MVISFNDHRLLGERPDAFSGCCLLAQAGQHELYKKG